MTVTEMSQRVPFVQTASHKRCLSLTSVVRAEGNGIHMAKNWFGHLCPSAVLPVVAIDSVAIDAAVDLYHQLPERCPQREQQQHMQSWVSHNSGFLKKIRVSVPGASKLDHSQQVEPILFRNFQKVQSLYWRANSYYPRGPLLRKGKRSHLKKRMRQGYVRAFGIQLGPIGVK